MNSFGFLGAAQRVIEKMADGKQSLCQRRASDGIGRRVGRSSGQPLFESRHESPVRRAVLWPAECKGRVVRSFTGLVPRQIKEAKQDCNWWLREGKEWQGYARRYGPFVDARQHRMTKLDVFCRPLFIDPSR